mgnify:CR=1 FL=1
MWSENQLLLLPKFCYLSEIAWNIWWHLPCVPVVRLTLVVCTLSPLMQTPPINRNKIPFRRTFHVRADTSTCFIYCISFTCPYTSVPRVLFIIIILGWFSGAVAPRLDKFLTLKCQWLYFHICINSFQKLKITFIDKKQLCIFMKNTRISSNILNPL